MPKKSVASSPEPSVIAMSDTDIPHIVRITLLGLSGLTYDSNAIHTVGEKAKARKSRGAKAIVIPEPSDVRAFVSLTRQTVIGTKFLPPLCKSDSEPVYPNNTYDDIEVISVIESFTMEEMPGLYHIIWPEDGASGRENKFVFETMLPVNSTLSDNQGCSEYIPKVFNLDIGLYKAPVDTEIEKTNSPSSALDEFFGIVLGKTTIPITGHESCPAKLSANADMSTTIFSQVMYLPILNIVGSNTLKKKTKLNEAVRVLKNHKDSNASSPYPKSRQKKTPTANPPSSTEVEAFKSKYSFQSGQGFLVVTLEVYKKASDEEQRIDFIRKQLKKQAMNINTSPGVYQMVRYLSSSESFSSYEYISRAIHVYAKSKTKASTENMIQKRISTDIEALESADGCIVIASMSSLMDESEEEDDADDADSGDDDESESGSDKQDPSTDEEKYNKLTTSDKYTQKRTPSSLQNGSDGFFSRIKSCSAEPIEYDIPKSLEVLVRKEQSTTQALSSPSSFSLLAHSSIKGITDFLSCQARVDPALLKSEEATITTTKAEVKKRSHYDDDQTIFSGIPYLTDQKL